MCSWCEYSSVLVSFCFRVLYEEKPVPRGGPKRKDVPAWPCGGCDAVSNYPFASQFHIYLSKSSLTIGLFFSLQYFKAAGIDAASVQRICRHRAWNPRPQTPPGNYYFLLLHLHSLYFWQLKVIFLLYRLVESKLAFPKEVRREWQLWRGQYLKKFFYFRV